MVDLFCKYWNSNGDQGSRDNDRDNQSDNRNLTWIDQSDGGPHEANFLKLDCSRIKTVFGWKPRWTINTAVEKTVEWSKAWQSGKDVREVMNKQIEEFLLSTTANISGSTASGAGSGGKSR